MTTLPTRRHFLRSSCALSTLFFSSAAPAQTARKKAGKKGYATGLRGAITPAKLSELNVNGARLKSNEKLPLFLVSNTCGAGCVLAWPRVSNTCGLTWVLPLSSNCGTTLILPMSNANVCELASDPLVSSTCGTTCVLAWPPVSNTWGRAKVRACVPPEPPAPPMISPAAGRRAVAGRWGRGQPQGQGGAGRGVRFSGPAWMGDFVERDSGRVKQPARDWRWGIQRAPNWAERAGRPLSRI
jgi:hypothetical protein